MLLLSFRCHARVCCTNSTRQNELLYFLFFLTQLRKMYCTGEKSGCWKLSRMLVTQTFDFRDNRTSRLIAAIGIECSAETVHAVLHDVRRKVLDRVPLPIADFGSGNVQQNSASASKSAVFFPARTERYVRAGLLLSLHKQRK